jgi:hypothetical protein
MIGRSDRLRHVELNISRLLESRPTCTAHMVTDMCHIEARGGLWVNAGVDRRPARGLANLIGTSAARQVLDYATGFHAGLIRARGPAPCIVVVSGPESLQT